MTKTKSQKALAGIKMPQSLNGKSVGILAGRVDHISLPLKGVRFLGKRGSLLDNMGVKQAEQADTAPAAKS